MPPQSFNHPIVDGLSLGLPQLVGHHPRPLVCVVVTGEGQRMYHSWDPKADGEGDVE
jgi:hypothetical protein